MKEITLSFPSLEEMTEFETITSVVLIHKNSAVFALTGTFSEADIELAKAGFNATVSSEENRS